MNKIYFLIEIICHIRVTIYIHKYSIFLFCFVFYKAEKYPFKSILILPLVLFHIVQRISLYLLYIYMYITGSLFKAPFIAKGFNFVVCFIISMDLYYSFSVSLYIERL